jgi:hypothetical protein
MAKYHYKVTHETGNHLWGKDLEVYLNRYGEKGWRLISVVHNGFNNGNPGIASADFYWEVKEG